MNLNFRRTTVVSGKEILYDIVGIKTENVTLDATKFKPGIIPAGTALMLNATTNKVEPWTDPAGGESTGEASLLFRDIRIDDKDIVSVGLIGGYVKEARCTGVTDTFKKQAKMLYFK